MERDLVIGIDSSTSATKAIAWNRRGEPVAEGRAAIPMANPRPGYFEQDPEDWWGSTASALSQVAQKIDIRRVAGAAISNQRETFSAFADDGTPLRPGMVWLDDRALPQVRSFGESFGAERIHAISGKPLDVIPPLYRLMWLREQEHEIFYRTAKFAEVHGYLTFRLTGEWATSTASADPTGMLDMRTFDWSSEILDAAGVPREKMLRLVRPAAFLGEISGQAATATGLPEGLPLFAGGGDGQCAATGVAGLKPGRAYANLGTAAVAGLYGDVYIANRAFRTETAVGDGGYIYEMCLRTGTFLIDWLVEPLFGHTGPERRNAMAALEAEAAQFPAGSSGLVVTPYWQGCMTPHWDGDARGIIAGLTGSTRRAHIYRAALEGIAIEIVESMDRASTQSGRTLDHYVAIGGGASSALWLQILADLSAKPVYRLSSPEASALGAGMAAAKGVGWWPTVSEASEAMASGMGARFDPDPQRVEVYRELRALQLELWPIVSRWNRRLSEFGRRQ
jgi:sugar (pentulose or hexulose) kinase